MGSKYDTMDNWLKSNKIVLVNEGEEKVIVNNHTKEEIYCTGWRTLKKCDYRFRRKGVKCKAPIGFCDYQYQNGKIVPAIIKNATDKT